jgi:hypothetical protein
MHVDADDPRVGCVNGELDVELVVGDGSLTRYRVIFGRRGAGQQFTFSLFRDQITISDGSRKVTGRWSVDETGFSISALDTDRCEDLSDWSAAPFERLDGQGAP